MEAYMVCCSILLIYVAYITNLQTDCSPNNWSDTMCVLTSAMQIYNHERHFAKKWICWNDAINYLSKGARDFVNSHISATVNVLQNKSEIESYSFWLFIFDGPHPSNLREDFNVIYTKVLAQNVFQANLLRKAYVYLIESEKHH